MISSPFRVVNSNSLATQNENNKLLHSRLKAVCYMASVAMTIACIRSFFNPYMFFMAISTQLLTLVLCIANAVTLHSKPNLNKHTLNLLQIITFTSLVVMTVTVDLSVMVNAFNNNDHIYAVRSSHYMISACYAIFMVYGLFIPNKWYHTTFIVTAISLIPLAILLIVSSSLSFDLWKLVVPTALSTRTLTYLCIGIFCAIYGSHIMYSLRKENHEVKKMGQYQLEKKIGQGGMGEVWIATHQMLARPAAVKLIKQDKGLNDVHLQRFAREAQVTATLSCANTIRVFDFGVDKNNTFYYVMEFLKGMDLDALVVNHGPIPPERAIFILKQICYSLIEAHSRQLVHRDIKPANIFLCQQGIEYDFVKILDFGLVKSTEYQDENLSTPGTIMGTPAFMAPESITGASKVDGRTDVYAVGGIAFWLLTGELVFSGNNVTDLLLKHVNKTPPRPSDVLGKTIPPQLENLILSCLEKKQEKRPPSHMVLEGLLECEKQMSENWNRMKAQRWWLTKSSTTYVNKSLPSFTLG